MQTTFALVALAAVAYAAPQAGDIAPSAAVPKGCSPSYAGSFQITAVDSKVMKRDIYKRSCGDPGSLVITLTDGKLHDAKGRTGYVASNYQFQFDGPPQHGAIYTAGFSACSNGSLALGGSSVFYECLSGSFYNLYDRKWADHCQPILIDVLPCGSSGDAVGQQPDGQPTGTSIETITQIADGQPQAPTSPPVTEISDGQPQAPAASPAPISQIPDGQPQVPTAPAGPAITQIPDGQPQAPATVPTSASTGSFAPSFVSSPSSLHTFPGGSFASSIPVVTSTALVGTGSAPAGSSATTAPPNPPPTNSGNAVRSSLSLAAVAVIAAVFL